MAVPAQLEIWERRESVHLPHRSRIGERVGLSLGVPLPFFRKIQKIIDLALQKAETSSTLGDAEGKPLNWVLPLAGEDIGNCAGNLNPVARMPTPVKEPPRDLSKSGRKRNSCRMHSRPGAGADVDHHGQARKLLNS